MNFSAPFIRRPIATSLLAVGLLLAGAVAYWFLPVASLPSVDIPVIVVTTSRPGADPETMAFSIAAPLERRLGEIPGVTEITSTSSQGSSSIVIQFDLARDIDGAAHDVQAALNAATADLPGDLPNRPIYRKWNPSDAPIMTIALTSDTLPTAQLYDAADTILGQRLSQLDGVAQVTINGAEKPAVRVRLNPGALKAAGLSSQDVYTAIRAANVNGAVGSFQGPERAEAILLNGQITQATDYADLVLKRSGDAIVRLRDVASVIDGVANSRLAAWDGTHAAILLSITKSQNANVIETVDGIKATLPQLMSWLPPDIQVSIISDRTTTIRASVQHVEETMAVSVLLVLLVVLVFTRRLSPTLAATVTVPLSVAGTLAGMWFLGFTLDNFSLLALTISVGFVVDDAIVMIENIARHREAGMTRMAAALAGARQIGFTILSISISLVAVFIPVLFMGGVMGRMFREFSVVLTMAIAVSAAVSLTLTPMMCARLPEGGKARGPLRRVDLAIGLGLNAITRVYGRSLDWALRFRWLMLLVMLGTVAGTVWGYMHVPKGFSPIQDTGLLRGGTTADPNISFAAMAERQERVVRVILADPAVASVASTIGVSSGWSSLNRGQLTVSLKPLEDRGVTAEEVIARLRPTMQELAGIQSFLYSAQDMPSGGGGGGASSSFRFNLLDDNIAELREWTTRMEDALHNVAGIADVSSDQDKPGPQTTLEIDRDAASRLGVSVSAIDNALNNAFAQRQMSIIYTQRNQYRVVLETLPGLQTGPESLPSLFVPGTGGAQVPLTAVVRPVASTAALSVRHIGQFPSSSISFNLQPGTSLGQATDIVEQTALNLRMPATVRTSFGGNAQDFQKALASQPALIGAAFLAIYIVLGVLYESFLHPLTIISTLPAAGLGALLAIWVSGTELSIMSVIGIVLLMGIVKKNGIMLVDFALEAERERGLDPFSAIHEACMERFRPITMTTLAALLGAVPLVISTGTGHEFRQPLGIAICGGLVVSQALTLYTTPVIYLMLERLVHGRRRAVVLQPAE